MVRMPRAASSRRDVGRRRRGADADDDGDGRGHESGERVPQRRRSAWLGSSSRSITTTFGRSASAAATATTARVSAPSEASGVSTPNRGPSEVCPTASAARVDPLLDERRRRAHAVPRTGRVEPRGDELADRAAGRDIRRALGDRDDAHDLARAGRQRRALDRDATVDEREPARERRGDDPAVDGLAAHDEHAAGGHLERERTDRPFGEAEHRGIGVDRGRPPGRPLLELEVGAQPLALDVDVRAARCSSHLGSHQAALPASAMAAGTSVMRTRNASKATPIARRERDAP